MTGYRETDKKFSRQMKTNSHRFLVLIFVGASICCQSKREPDNANALRNKVTDHAQILTMEQEDSLITMIEDLELKVGSQIAILTITSLDGQKIEDFSLTTVTATGLGRATHNDGVLITIAYHDRQTRIEVGTGLENIVRDDVAAKIIREDMIPNFQQEKYALGLRLAVNKISDMISDNEDKIGQNPTWK